MAATCPEGRTSIYWKDSRTASGKPNIHFAFSLSDCSSCAARVLCTRAEKIGRHLTVPPREAYEALRRARLMQESKTFKELYYQRAGIEGTISHAVHDMGVRLACYRVLVRTHLQHVATAAAINLRRLADWLAGDRPEPRRISPFAVLVAPI